MSEFSKEKMVDGINLELDVPFITEGGERRAIAWVIDRVYPIIPDYVLRVLYDALDGLDDAEITALENQLVTLANEKIDLPMVPEIFEEQLLRPVIKSMLQYAKTGLSL